MAYRIFRQVKKKSLRLALSEKQIDQQFRVQQNFKSTVVLNGVSQKNDTSVETKSSDGHPDIDLTFSSCSEAYRSKTNLQLFRAWFVLKLCSWSFLVDNNKVVRLLP